MRQLRKCSYVVTATFLDHDKVQKTDLKPLQLVKSEWSPPLQQLPVSSVSTKCLRIDSTKYSCVQFDVQFSTFVVNKLQCTFAWICVDFSWKTAFISYHVMSAKTCVLKCCCLLFDWPEFWESSPLLNRESWWAYGDVREKTAFLMFSQHPAWVITPVNPQKVWSGHQMKMVYNIDRFWHPFLFLHWRFRENCVHKKEKDKLHHHVISMVCTLIDQSSRPISMREIAQLL